MYNAQTGKRMKSKIGIIIGREFSERVHKKSFIFTTLFTPVLMIALIFTPMLISDYYGDDTERTVMVDAYGVISTPSDSEDLYFDWNGQPAMQEYSAVTTQQPVETQDDYSAEETSAFVEMMLAYVLSFILYMFILLYGVMVMQSVIEEKNNRVLEVLASTVRPFDMMMGKILGIACVALLQIIIWIVLIAGIAYYVLPHLLPDDILATLALMRQGIPAAAIEGGSHLGILQAIMILSDIGYVGNIVIWLFVFVFGGFLLYAAMFAAVGSAVDSPQDAQQLQTPIVLPLILSILVMLSVINAPASDTAFWFSMIPLTSPIIMMARIPYGVPTWEIALSAALLYATFIITVWGAGKIYRVGILMHGKKPNLKELWRWMRY